MSARSSRGRCCSSVGSMVGGRVLSACWVRHCRVFFGCIRCGCGCEGICCRGVEGENPVLFGRVGQLFCVGVELAVCAPELIGGGVVGD